MTVDRLEQIGREITARVGKLDQLGAKAVDQVNSIGHLLAEAEKLCETLEAFAAFKQQHCPDLSRSRTYELLAIKDGRKTLEGIRAATRARVAKHRAGKKVVTDKPSVTWSNDGRALVASVPDDAEAAIDDPLVVEKGKDEIEASPWFASKMKPIFEGAIKNDAAKSASALSQFRKACATFLPQLTVEDLNSARNILNVVSDLEYDVEKAIRKAKTDAANAKRIKWEAKNPDKAKEKAREEAQEEAMSDDRDEAKTEARENGEIWGDVEDEWIEDWIANNWDEQAEADFESEFQVEWQRDHGKSWAPASSKAAA